MSNESTNAIGANGFWRYYAVTGSSPTTLVSVSNVYTVPYDTKAVDEFEVGETLTFSGGSTATLLMDETTVGETTGTMTFTLLLSAVPPADDETIAAGTSSTTATVNGTPALDSGRSTRAVITGWSVNTESTADFRATIQSAVTSKPAFGVAAASTGIQTSSDQSGVWIPMAAGEDIEVAWVGTLTGYCHITLMGRFLPAASPTCVDSTTGSDPA